ncbi:hypothetical protein [Kiloniella sp.]|uniref:hypothetical protein n=1 Tax=Kiloniella sp. TaxID=1938587 RepID=UPI003B01AEE9
MTRNISQISQIQRLKIINTLYTTTLCFGTIVAIMYIEDIGKYYVKGFFDYVTPRSLAILPGALIAGFLLLPTQLSPLRFRLVRYFLACLKTYGLILVIYGFFGLMQEGVISGIIGFIREPSEQEIEFAFFFLKAGSGLFIIASLYGSILTLPLYYYLLHNGNPILISDNVGKETIDLAVFD